MPLPRASLAPLCAAVLCALAGTPVARAAEPEKKSDALQAEREQKELESAKRRQAEAERAGEVGLARRLAALSARWTKVLDALATAAKLEAEAARLEGERIAVQEETDRLTTLVEQTEARRARALAKLQALGLESAEASSPAPASPPQAVPPAPAAPATKGAAP
jgi:hypothetical protein